jgi:hypothetical protein
MQLRPEIQITSMIKSLKDVIIPAIDSQNSFATEQAHLVVGMLSLMITQLPMQFRFDCDQLERSISTAKRLEEVYSRDTTTRGEMRSLIWSVAQASETLKHFKIDPVRILETIHELNREICRLISFAAEKGCDPVILAEAEAIVLDSSREQLLRDRALLVPQGWEKIEHLAPPPIETLLAPAS